MGLHDVIKKYSGRHTRHRRSQVEEEILSGLEDFVKTRVGQIMRPRIDIVAIGMDEDYAMLKKVIVESGFSRIPVYEQTLDNIKGVLYVKDMLPFIREGDDFRWQDHLRKPYFVPQQKLINDLMSEFQSNKVHLGIVVDEYGSTVGLVSLEDILEEVVGEIVDESDAEESAMYTKLDDSSYIFDGKCHLGEFASVVGLNEGELDDVRGEAETVAGLMLELNGDLLKKGESVSAHGINFTALSIDGRRIDQVRVEMER